MTLLNPEAIGLSGLLSKKLLNDDADEVVEKAAVLARAIRTNSGTRRARVLVRRVLLDTLLIKLRATVRGFFIGAIFLPEFGTLDLKTSNANAIAILIPHR